MYIFCLFLVLTGNWRRRWIWSKQVIWIHSSRICGQRSHCKVLFSFIVDCSLFDPFSDLWEFSCFGWFRIQATFNLNPYFFGIMSWVALKGHLTYCTEDPPPPPISGLIAWLFAELKRKLLTALLVHLRYLSREICLWERSQDKIIFSY